MIWLDITDPKYALFFQPLLPHLLGLDSVLITSRVSSGYEECAQILSHAIESHHRANPSFRERLKLHFIGGYGGANRLDKYRARLDRERGFLELFARLGELPRVFITGASVEGAQCAFGLGVPVVHFSDTPIAGHEFSPSAITLLARLSLPLSCLVFYPFVIPSSVYKAFGLDSSNIICYDFIDPALYLPDIQSPLAPDSSVLQSRSQSAQTLMQSEKKHNYTPLIIAREEEYKAHYVSSHLRLWYEGVHALARENVDILIIPRYGREELELEFGTYSNIQIAQHIIAPEQLYAHADLLLGGGGTMNLEACYYGIPTISTRSLLLYHDCYLIEHNLMRHVSDLDSLMQAFREIQQTGFARKNPAESKALFAPTPIAQSLQQIADIIAARFFAS